MRGAHAGPKGQLLHASDAVLRHLPAVLLLERAAEDGGWSGRSTCCVVRATRAMIYRCKNLVLSCRRGTRAAMLLRRASGIAVERPAKARSSRGRSADG